MNHSLNFTRDQKSIMESRVLSEHLKSFGLSLEDMQLPWKHSNCTPPYQHIETSKTSEKETAMKVRANICAIIKNGSSQENQNLVKKFQELPVDEQLHEFIIAHQPSRESLKIRWQFILDIQIILRDHYPHCELYPFGSFVSGLGNENSDIDIFVDVSGDHGNMIAEDPRGKEAVLHVRDNVMDIMSQSKCPHTLDSFVVDIKALGTRVPYIKFYHSPTKIECDLTFGNRLSWRNCRLTQFYMKLDARIRPFLVVLLHWKNHGVLRDIKFRKYPLVLLAIVFLIQKKILPNVKFLQDLALEQRERKQRIRKNPEEIDGWDSSFCEDVDLIKSRFVLGDSSSSVLELVLEFLETVAKINFAEFIVCPQMGALIPKRLLQYKGTEVDRRDFPKSWERWAANQLALKKKLKIDTPVCIQDSFVLNDNVAGLIDKETLIKFQNCCRKAAKRQINGRDKVTPELLSIFTWTDC